MRANRSVETFSPEWLIAVLDRLHRSCQQRAAGFWANAAGTWLLAGLSLASAAMLMVLRVRLLRLFAGSDQFLYQMVAYVFPIAIPVLLVPFALFTRSPASQAGGRLTLFVASLAALLWSASGGERIPLLVCLGVSFFVPLAGFALSLRLPAGRRLPPILAFTVCASFLLGYAVTQFRGDWRFLYYVLFSLPLMPLSWLAESHMGNGNSIRPFSLSFYSYYFSSLNINYFLAVQPSDLESNTDPKQIFPRGLWNLWTGVFFISASRLFNQGGILHAGGYGTYLFFFFCTWGVLRIAVGIGQLLGFDLAPPFYYPLLSADPVIHWKRWNTYFYRWYRNLIFFPVVRRTNSVFLAMGLIFAANYYLHTAQYLFVPLFLRSPAGQLNAFLSSIFYFFMCHAALIYICLVTQRYWPSGRSRWGWLGVGVTNLAMVMIHLFRS